jgi:hypothetical protein
MKIFNLLLIGMLITGRLLADDFTLINGKQYKGVTVTRVEPDGIMVMTDTGIEKLYFTWLPKEVQQKYGYNPQVAASYAAQESQAQHALYQQAEQDRENAGQAAQQAQQAQDQAKTASAKAAQAKEFLVETDQVIDGGVLVETVTMDSWQAVDASSMASIGGGGGVSGGAGGTSYNPTGKVLFIQGMPKAPDGANFQIKAYPDGMYSRDGQTLEKWVFVSEKPLK